PGQHPADDRVVTLQQLAPLPVAQLGSPAGRAHDVREHHRGEYAVEPCLLLDQVVQEASDLPEDPVAPAVPVEPVEAPVVLDLHDLGPRDPRGGESTVPRIRVSLPFRIYDDQ